MENKNRISYAEFIADIKAREDNETIVHWLGQDVVIKKYLNMKEELAFVASVVDVCYQGEGEVLVYTPEVQAFAVQHSLVSYYTNIDLEEVEDSDFDIYDFVTRSGIIDIIMEHIDIQQYNTIINAIGSKIKYINESSVASIMSEMGSLNNAINELVPQIQEFMTAENMESVQNALEVLSAFSQDNTVRKLAIEQVKNGI